MDQITGEFFQNIHKQINYYDLDKNSPPIFSKKLIKNIWTEEVIQQSGFVWICIMAKLF